MLAEEMGLDGKLARRCGLLHDIGKAADHEAEGGHPKIGADLLKRYGERPEVVHAALRPPRRPAHRQPLHGAGGRGRRLQRLAARRPPRNARTLRQADGGTGVDRQQLLRRRAGLCHPGRPRIARDRQRQGNHRRIGGQDLPRYRQGLRGATDLSRRNQSHRVARNAARGDGEIREDKIGDWGFE